MEKLVLGDGFQEGVTQGPLVNKSQFTKVPYKVIEAYTKRSSTRYRYKIGTVPNCADPDADPGLKIIFF